MYDCSEEFYERGSYKVKLAMEQYEKLIADPLFDLKDYVKEGTL